MDYRHLRTLTDNTGMIQFARGAQPDPNSGYTVDDNARALLVALRMEGEEREQYAQIYIRFLYSAQRENGEWCNLKLKRGFVPYLDSEDSVGRAFAACSVAADCDIEEVRRLARKMVVKALPAVFELKNPRSMAYALLGSIKSYFVFPQYRGVLAWAAGEFSDRLIDLYSRNMSSSWKWFEDSLTYCNAILPHALFAYYAFSGDQKALRAAEEAMGFLRDKLLEKGYLHIIGNRGWWSRGKEIPLYDQQPVDACSMVLACLEAFQATGKKDYLSMADIARAWYWGKNINKVSLYNVETGGCHDALTPEGVNLNQGAEAVISFLFTQQVWKEMQKGGYTRETYLGGEPSDKTTDLKRIS